MELKVPPVVVFLISVASVFGFWFFIEANFSFRFQNTIAGVFILAGVLMGLLAIIRFRKQATTVDPTAPNKATNLVTKGIYQYTRNPMYLGMALVLLGGIIRIGNPFGLLSMLFHVWYMTRFQIKPEERTLTALFGQPYIDYLNQVRRWL